MSADRDMMGKALGIEFHLQHNHYPPVPSSMVPVCEAAIDNANADDWDAAVELPEGVTYKGSTTAPTWAIVEQHHLTAWIDDGEVF